MQVSSTGSSSLSALTALQMLKSNSATTTTTSDSKAAAPPPPPPPPPSNSSGAEPQSLFSALVENDDADGSGTISAAEIASSPVSDLLSESFSTIDSDGDGQLTQTEMTEFEGAMKEAGGPPPGPPPSGPPPDGGSASSDEEEDAVSVLSSLQESLVQALASSEDSASVSLDSDLAKQFLALFEEVA